MFEIGDKVKCVEDYKLPHTRAEIEVDCPNWVKKGDEYHVRGFADNNGIVTGVYLEEIVNPVRFFSLINRSQESAFRIDRFSKMQEDEVEVAVEEFSEVF